MNNSLINLMGVKLIYKKKSIHTHERGTFNALDGFHVKPYGGFCVFLLCCMPNTLYFLFE